jgi:hypothetical protein
MNTKTLGSIAAFLSLALPAGESVYAQHFLDNFEDNDLRDESPVNWTVNTVLDGKLQIRGSGNSSQLAIARVESQVGWSMRTQASVGDGYYVGAGILADNNENVWIGMTSGGSLELGTPGLTRASVQTELDPNSVMLRFDAFDDLLIGWAWNPGEPEPAEPLLKYATAIVKGRPGLWMQGLAGGPNAIAEFEFFEASTTPLTSDTGVAGDFNGNRLLDVDDINQLTVVSASGSHDVAFDLNSDGRVNAIDVTAWIKDLGNSWVGDSNFDGEFNSADFVAVFQAGRYEQDSAANWSEGDWDGDGRFDSADFVAAFQDGGYEQGKRNAVVAVPEPTSMSLLLAIGIGMAIRPFRRSVFR